MTPPYEAAVPSEIVVRLCCHQLCNHAVSFSVLLQAILPTWFDRRGAIFPFLWRTSPHEATVPSEVDMKLCCFRLSNHVGSLRVLCQAILPTWFGRRGAIFPFLWRTSPHEATIPSDVDMKLCCFQLSNHVGSFSFLLQAIFPTWFDRRGAIFPFLWRTPPSCVATVPPEIDVRLCCHRLCNHAGSF